MNYYLIVNTTLHVVAFIAGDLDFILIECQI